VCRIQRQVTEPHTSVLMLECIWKGESEDGSKQNKARRCEVTHQRAVEARISPAPGF
jgi:hypothetical protein